MGNKSRIRVKGSEGAVAMRVFDCLRVFRQGLESVLIFVTLNVKRIFIG